jgi:hypothetical protein
MDNLEDFLNDELPDIWVMTEDNKWIKTNYTLILIENEDLLVYKKDGDNIKTLNFSEEEEISSFVRENIK